MLTLEEAQSLITALELVIQESFVKVKEHAEKLKPAIAEVDKILSDQFYGNPPRGKMAGPSLTYLQAKDRVAKAESKKDYEALKDGLKKLEDAIKSFKEAQPGQLTEDRERYLKQLKPVQSKLPKYDIWIGQGKIAGEKANEFVELYQSLVTFEAKLNYGKALEVLPPLLKVTSELEETAAEQIESLSSADSEEKAKEAEKARLTSEEKRIKDSLKQAEGITKTEKLSENEAKALNFKLRRERIEGLVAQLDKGLQGKKFGAQFAEAAKAYQKDKTKLLKEAGDEAGKEKPDYEAASKPLDKLELIIRDLEDEIQKAALKSIQELQGTNLPPLSKKVLDKIKEEATRYAKLDPRALKGLDPKILDQMVGSVGSKAKSSDDKAMVKAALISKYDMVGAEGDLDTKALPRLYEIMKNLPASHTRNNPQLKKIKRLKPGKGENETASFYSGGEKGYIYLSLKQPGKLTEAYDQDADVDPEYKIDQSEHSRFDATTLHEIGHAVDDNESFMKSNGSKPLYGGWLKHEVNEVAEAVGEAKGFFKAFAQPRILLRTYLLMVLNGEDDPKSKMKGRMTQPEAGSEFATREELLEDPAVVQASVDRARYLKKKEWDHEIIARASSDAALLSKSRGMKRTVMRDVINRILPHTKEESISAEDAVQASLARISYMQDFDVDASNPNWDNLNKHAAVGVCKAIRLNGNNGLWREKSTGATQNKVGSRVYQEAYKGDWYSYDAAARKKGVSAYQFRAPAEWFAETYSAFFMKKLPKAHPLHAWLTNEVKPGS